ncbi:hypothetical protein SNE26_09035 [Mucilaginibacter sp. cycad4]|uniref:hypothetical protein n=1 Tax=Mucilaginibacter sp. cycad4 TaxID=3342096 RepID=UPI002AAB1328|nr:hypothetical protein [Mucilaginibacter gossypii]WPV01916.1 hypothetical protein SNE26_09035 [Mucilaginibacter gossypii]
MQGICKLCLRERELRHSHILPEFMYQNIYDAQPKRFYSLNIDLSDEEKSFSKIQQKGIREYLLCTECEGLLSKYENYAAETIYAKNKGNKAYIVNQSETINQDGFLYEYAGFSYPDFKIFLMSLLWRLIISDSFQTPDVAPEIAEKLRAAILSQNPLEYDDFGCLLQVIKYKKGEIMGNFILQPFLTKNAKSDIINILIDGFMYSFYLNSKSISESQKEVFLKEDGKMQIVGRIIFHDKGLLERVMAAYKYFMSSVKK